MRPLALSAFLFGLATLPLAARPDDGPPAAAERFDAVVREDIFAGLNGDADAMAKGVAACDAALARDPKHAEALVWRGAARVFQAGQLFGKGKSAQAFPLWSKGLADMDKAVELEPTNPGVRIPRAAVLVPAGRNSPPAMGKPLLQKAAADYEFMEKAHADAGELAALKSHPRGELRMGLADVYRALGEAEKSKAQLDKVVTEMPGTKYAKRAAEWLAAKPEAKLAHNCIGCHTK